MDAATPIDALLMDMGRRARAAAAVLAQAPHDVRCAAITAMAQRIREATTEIARANAADIAALGADRNAAFIDRLRLDDTRIHAIAAGVDAVAKLPDPLARVLEVRQRPNGLRIEKVPVPLGVIGMIYESRPNVGADAGSLAVKSGNAIILRGGADAVRSGAAIAQCLAAGLADAGLPEDAIQFVERAERDAVGLMLAGLGGSIDVIVPRGGKSLVARVHAEARVPVFAHLDGNNHVYVDKAADAEMARTVVLNAKLRRTGICGSAETLLVDSAAPAGLLAMLLGALIEAGCAVRGDAVAQAADARVLPATAADWDTEYLDAIIACASVDGVDGAIAHIARHGSHHTDAIITADDAAAARFLAAVDSAIVLHNASTQFADGGEFGMGAEIGIATGRFHARGPVGAEGLTTYKYIVRGSGQIRPV